MAGLTINEPVDLLTAINSRNVIPGDILLLRGGRYSGNWTLNIGGTEEAPVTIKPYNLESVIIDGTLTFGKPHLKIIDIDFTNSNSNRLLWDDGITMNQAGCWLIGCNIYDMHSDGVNWFGSGAGGVVECRIYNCGSLAEGQINDFGHAIYTHNNNGGTRLIARNLLLPQIGRYGIHIYSSSDNYLKDYICEDNVNLHPVHAGGGLGLNNFTYQRNIQSNEYTQIGRYSIQSNDIGIIQDNKFIDLSSYSIYDFNNLTEINNIVWGGEPSSRLGYTLEEKPNNWSYFIEFSLSERWAGIQCTIINGVFSASIVNKN